MSENKTKKRGFFTELMFNNPVFGLYLGICSTLALSTNITNALGMGVSVIIVLTCSNIIISLIAPLTPDDIHIPVYIVVIATLVTIVSMVLHAYAPQLYSSMGAFLDLIVVNCIILGRAEAYACNHNVLESAKDGLMMGLSYTMSLLAMSLIRQFFGTGGLSFTNVFTGNEVFNFTIIPEGFEIPVLTTQTGAFLTFACLAATVAAFKAKVTKKEAAEAKATAQESKVKEAA